MKTLKASRQEPPQLKKWACHKLECIAGFVRSYAASHEKSYFLDLFPGSRAVSCQVSQCPQQNPMLEVFKSRPPFAGYILLAGDKEAADKLKEELKPLQGNVSIITGSAISDKVMRQVFDNIPRSAGSFALIDPPGYRRLRWSTIKKLADHGRDWQGHKPELLIIFPLEMALERNLSRPQCEGSIERFYGGSQWLEIRKLRQEGRLGLDETRQRLIELYKTGLKKLGYRFVESLVPPRFSNPPFYNVIWASDSDGQQELLGKAWTETRYLPCELFG